VKSWDVPCVKSTSAAEWAQDEFGAVELEDARWRRRLVLVAERAARCPGGKVTAVISGSAERQGAYGLLESGAVAASAIAKGMFRACAERCAGEPFVFCPTDGSSLTLVDRAKRKFGPIGSRDFGVQGLKVISVLAVSAEGVTLGLTGQVWWTRSQQRPAKKCHYRRPEEKETRHWLQAMEQARETMRPHAPKTRVWFQLDREGDAWPILQQADADEQWFTVRGSHDRRVRLPDGRKTYLRSLLASQPVVSRYSLPVAPGPHRQGRTATMVIRACQATLDFRDKRTDRPHFSKTLNVVLTQEEGTTPAGERPIEWLLLTNRPVSTEKELQQIVFGYSQRWRIEDFHRSWKSGACRVEESQLRSPEAAIKWATILAAVATRVERLKLLSRREPDRPATDEFSTIELRALKLLRFGKSGNKSVTQPNGPTLSEATLWLAQLGGYTGKSSGGPPGSVTLARGLTQLQAATRALEALDPSCD
jgi:Transposase DNA-binding/Transposase DDE domain